MKQYANGYVGNRVLKLNVGFLLADGPGHTHETSFDVPAIRVADDVDLAYLRGPLRLSRTKEGILVQGLLHVGIEEECYRCLDAVLVDHTVGIEELFQYPSPVDAEYGIDEDAVLDLGPLIRSEAIIADARGVLCREDCKGLCPNCGANWNHETCTCGEVQVDPRFAKLKQLLER
ncbi:MAG: DUF177 domain-containing protein [Chloroflexi bacterium]|nr:DUF177 domain-containing protein [Chloroflexota bacterium]